ncbi:ribonucleotide-diphosphate reductase subunit beta [Aurantivibrio plasticivorans]
MSEDITVEEVSSYELLDASTLDNRAIPKFQPQEWDKGGFDIQSWLERTATNRLADTEFGGKKNILGPTEAVMTDPLLNQVCKTDLAVFLTAEKVSMNNLCQMVSFAPDEASQVFLATQSLDEARHYEVFCRRLADLGVKPEEREQMVKDMTMPKMQQFYDLINEQVDKKAFIPALLAHNVVLEGMVYPFYRYEIRYWSRLDPALSNIIRNVFADEVQHVSYGEHFIAQEARMGSPMRATIQKLAGEFHQLMSEVFEEAITNLIGIYQASADKHASIMADVEIFPGMKMGNMSEEDQTRRLLSEIQEEYQKRLQAIGFA